MHVWPLWPVLPTHVLIDIAIVASVSYVLINVAIVACVAYVLINVACVADSLNPAIGKSNAVTASRHSGVRPKGRNVIILS